MIHFIYEQSGIDQEYLPISPAALGRLRPSAIGYSRPEAAGQQHRYGAPIVLATQLPVSDSHVIRRNMSFGAITAKTTLIRMQASLLRANLFAPCDHASAACAKGYFR